MLPHDEQESNADMCLAVYIVLPLLAGVTAPQLQLDVTPSTSPSSSSSLSRPVIKYDAVLAAASHSAIPAIVQSALKEAREITEETIIALHRSRRRSAGDIQPIHKEKEMDKEKGKGFGEEKGREEEKEKEGEKDDARSVCSFKTTNMQTVSYHLPSLLLVQFQLVCTKSPKLSLPLIKNNLLLSYSCRRARNGPR